MSIILRKVRYVHVPKCAGNWVRDALERGCPYHARCNFTHCTLPMMPGDGLLSFATIRDPARWHESYWAFRMKQSGLRPRHGPPHMRHLNDPLDDCMAPNFRDFARAVIQRGVGVMDEFLKSFITEETRVLRVEDMPDALIAFLFEQGEDHDADAIRDTPHKNESNYDKFPAECTPKQEGILREMNPWAWRLWNRK